ncbi:MAG TPA: radical SAM protein [Thermomicrobiaceae bacterium]|nr:radical SAM protein [Thermomicrobiaceae bacterium]
MTEVLFGQSYFLRFDPKLWDAMQPYPPLGTLYAASYLRARGYDVAVFDAMLATSEDEWRQALDRHAPRYAVLFEDNFNYLSKMCLLRMRDAALTMITMARAAGATVIVCGADASDHADQYLAGGAHYILIGEGEETLAELLEHLTGRTDRPPSAIRGLAFVEPERQAVTVTPRRPDMRDLDALPFPAWDLVDIPRYRQVWQARHGYYSMNLVTTRGCPFHCNWCAKPIWGQRYHARSPENVVAEVKWLEETYHPDHLWFVDDIMGLKPGWIERFADLVVEQDARVPFKCLNRADLLLRGGTIAALARAGAKTVWVGAESGSQKILDAMEKGTRVEQLQDVARRLRQAGIEVGFFIQFGYPGETRADIEQTLQMIRDCEPDDVGMSVSYPLPGTRFHERVKDELGVKQNWLDSNDLAMLYHGPYSTAFYRQLHTVLHTEFRSRKSWSELKELTRSPRRLRRRHLRQAAALVKHGTSLPLERWRLNRLERRSEAGIGALQPLLQQDEAATPSAQPDA